MEELRIVSLLEKERPRLTPGHRARIARRLAGREWSIKDVRDLYGVGWSTVRRWIQSGELKARREGKFWVIDPEDAAQAPGRFARGWYQHKLSAEEAREVRRRRRQGEKIREIAEDFGIHESLVTRIENHERYADVEEE